MSKTMVLIVASTAVIITTALIENVAITDNENVAIVDVGVILIEVDEGDILSASPLKSTRRGR